MAHLEYVRVRDTDTGYEMSVPSIVSPETQQLLDEPAADRHGRPLPPNHNPKKARQASTPKAPEPNPADAPEQPEEAN